MAEIILQRVAIVGAGQAGGALAAHLINLGFAVTLIDETVALAATAVEHARPSLYVHERAGEIRTLALADAAEALADAEWIVEAVPERIEVKRGVYQAIGRAMRPDAIVTTSSASLPVAELAQGAPEGFAERFLAAWFALPIAERRLVEVREGADPALARDFARFLEAHVARRPLVLPDGPGGIVGRYGIWSLLLGVHAAERLRLGVEDVDAIAALVGVSDGVFGPVDRLGLDEIRDTATNLRARLPDDRGARFLALPASFSALLARGWTGDKSGRGFYRREGREHLALDLTTMAYRQPRLPSLPGLASLRGEDAGDHVRRALASRDEVGEFLREFNVTALRYAEYLRDATGASVIAFDRTMEWGFGWARGPFAMLDELRIGAARYYHEGTYWSAGGYRPMPKEESVSAIGAAKTVEQKDAYMVQDLGDGVQALVLRGGTLTPESVAALNALLQARTMERFVLASEGPDFPDLDLPFLLEALKNDPVRADAYLGDLQSLSERLEASTCVAAVARRCAGPSLGLALSCAAIVALADAALGFDEAQAGLLPTARGTAIMRAYHGEGSRKMSEVAAALAEGVVAPNADTARALGFLRETDAIEHLPERLMSAAKDLAKAATARPLPDFVPTEPVLPGLIDRALTDRRQRGGLTEFGVSIGHRIRQVVARTDGYAACVERERKESLDLGARALTQARIRHLIETGKPLRN